MVTMKALILIEESNDFSSSAAEYPASWSKFEARQLLDKVMVCRVNFRELRIPEDKEILLTLR